MIPWTDPERAVVRDLGHALATEGRLSEAETIFRGLLALDPADAYAHLALGWILRRTGRPEEAREAFRRSLEHDRRNPAAAVSWAEIELTSGRPEAAREVLGLLLHGSGAPIPRELRGRIDALLRRIGS